MTKFFKTLEELKASLPTTVNLWLGDVSCTAVNFGATEAQRTALVVNGNDLEKYLYTASLSKFTTSWVQNPSYNFKLVANSPVANYKAIIESKNSFEASLPKEYVKSFSFSDLLILHSDLIKEGNFFSPKTAIVTNGDKFQEILYTPVKGKCLDSNWFTGFGKWEVEYQSEVVSEASISEILAEFGL